MRKDAPRGQMTFIVRLSRDRHGRILGIVERVKTGRKERCAGLAGIGDVIGRMLGAGGKDGQTAAKDCQ